MKTYLMIVCMGLFLSPLFGCQDKHEKALADVIESLEDAVTLFKGITDEKSARAAIDDIDKLGERMGAANKVMQGLDAPSEEKDKELGEKFGARWEKVMQDLMGEFRRIEGMPQLKPILMEPLTRFRNKIK